MAEEKKAKGGKGGGTKPAGGRRAYYKVEGTSLRRLRKACPKCGPGIFLADHKDRTSCGACGYTEFRK